MLIQARKTESGRWTCRIHSHWSRRPPIESPTTFTTSTKAIKAGIDFIKRTWGPDMLDATTISVEGSDGHFRKMRR